jgi:hypothetical protein
MVILYITAGATISPAVAAIAIAGIIVKATEPAVVTNIQRVIVALAVPVILEYTGYRKAT